MMREGIYSENKARVNWMKKYDNTEAFDYDPSGLPTGDYANTDHFSEPASHHVPGYAGYIPQGKFTFGSPYGKVTEGVYGEPQNFNQTWQQAQQQGYPQPQQVQAQGYTQQQQPVLNAIPQARLPQISRKSGKLRGAAFHCPGYSGHVPGKNERIARTYPAITRDCLRQRQAMNAERSRQVAELSGTRGRRSFR